MTRPHSARIRSRSQRRDRREPAGVPAVLPHIVMDVAMDGTMAVAVDGAPHDPPPFAPPWRRGDFAAILDQLTGQRRVPVRIEVRETDGSVFTDIIAPSARRSPGPAPEHQEPGAAAPRPLALHGGGFLPGEDVAVALVIAHTQADPDGAAHGVLTPDQAADNPTREAVLLGLASGTIATGHPA